MSQHTSPTQEIVVVHAGVGEPSSTRMLVDRVIGSITQEAPKDTPKIHVIELKTHTKDLANAALTGFAVGALKEAIDKVQSADALVFASPIYKASYSGLFKMFLDLLDNDAVLGKPVLLAATGGTPRHGLAVDDQMRPLFAYLRALTVPTSLYATAADWGPGGGGDVTGRITRAVRELLTLMRARISDELLDANWTAYQHTLKDAERSDGRTDFNYDPALIDAIYGGSLK